MIKSSGQMGNWLRVPWKELNARGLRPGPATFDCIGQPDESLKLIFSHADSEELRPFINTVTYTTVLSGFATTEHDKEASTFSSLFNMLVSFLLLPRCATQ